MFPKNVCFSINSEVKLALTPRRLRWLVSHPHVQWCLWRVQTPHASGGLFVAASTWDGFWSIEKIQEAYGTEGYLISLYKQIGCLSRWHPIMDTPGKRSNWDMCTNHMTNIRKVWLSFICHFSHQKNLLLHFPPSSDSLPMQEELSVLLWRWRVLACPRYCCEQRDLLWDENIKDTPFWIHPCLCSGVSLSEMQLFLSPNCPCGSNIGRRLYITSSPYREKDTC